MPPFTLRRCFLCLLGPCLVLACSDGDEEEPGESEAVEVIPLSQDCVDYLACVAETDADNYELYEGTYGSTGDCWGSDSEALACTQTCAAGLEVEHVANPRVEACWPEGQPDALALFASEPEWYLEPYREADRPCEAENLDDDRLFGIDADFYAEESGQSFVMELDFDRNHPWYSVSLDCQFEGASFTCLQAYGSGEVYNHSGRLSNNSTRLELDFVVTTVGEEYSCLFIGGPE